MMNVPTTCIDFASDYCPCKLAEAGCCIVCSRCAGGAFCDCAAPGGFCVMSELRFNGGRAKALRDTHTCRVADVVRLEENVIHARVAVPRALALELARPGSFVFVRIDENPFFDIPVSVQVLADRTVCFALMLKGVKTSRLAGLQPGDALRLRGPYWNGVLGLRGVYALRGARALVLARGIGLLPAVPVIRLLRAQGNDVTVLVDRAKLGEPLVDFYTELFDVRARKCVIFDGAALMPDIRDALRRAQADGIGHVHISGSDFLISSVTAALKAAHGTRIPVSCCNNERMCCGEGICGACALDVAVNDVRHLCKEQFEPYYFAGRKYL